MNAYPLTWPEGFPRTPKRLKGDRFRTSLAGALNNVEAELRRFGEDSGKKIENLVISSNVTLGVQNPPDPGVACWFGWDGAQVCIPVDRYQRVEHNLQAIALIIEARRTELRHGGLAIVKATFAGFARLPGPAQKPWREVFGFGPTEEVSPLRLEGAYRTARSEAHPDKGGNADAFRAIQKAYEAGKLELDNPA